MRLYTPVLAAMAVTLQLGCADSGELIQPTAPTASRSQGSAADHGVRRIEMFDDCDPASFDAALGTGTCTGSGGTTFQSFIAQVTSHGNAPAWRFAPLRLEAKVGQTLLAINRGGEAHTFTEVEEFGGGIVPLLNHLSGNPVVAPECQALADDDFIPPGGTDGDDQVSAPGTEKYQCCIHPWMRMIVEAHGS
ncbi:MAG: hypothetical protein JWL95_1540 [Gemmatimonadetes bacterium]|nr:hypothetical protein [Gemmatimonadota bacterium]